MLLIFGLRIAGNCFAKIVAFQKYHKHESVAAFYAELSWVLALF